MQHFWLLSNQIKKSRNWINASDADYRELNFGRDYGEAKSVYTTTLTRNTVVLLWTDVAVLGTGER